MLILKNAEDKISFLCRTAVDPQYRRSGAPAPAPAPGLGRVGSGIEDTHPARSGTAVIDASTC